MDGESKMAVKKDNKGSRTLDGQEASRFLEKAFGNLIQFVPEINLFAKDNSGRFLFVNQSFAEKCGKRSPEELIGLTDLDVWPKTLGEKYQKDDQGLLKDGKPRVDILELITVAGQSTEWHSTTKVAITDVSGNILGVAGFSRSLKMPPLGSSKPNGILAIRDSIHAHFAKPFNLKQMAEKACLSISQFDRRFKAAFKMSPRQYVSVVRIQAACQALASTEDQISKIARDCGYYDLSHLNHLFKREMGISPKDYRKAYSKV
jgi:AraC-like DNA-binding protein